MLSEVLTMNAIARCECGALEVHVSGPPVVQLTCHCRDCQAFSGQDCVAGAFFRKESCRITGSSRSESLHGGTGSEKRHHACAVCGTPLYVEVEALNGAVAILAGRLAPFSFQSEVHVWTSQKAAGSGIPADARQVPGPPPEDVVQRMMKGFWGG